VYKLRGQTRIDITRLGSNDVPANSIKILKGDVLGYYFTGRSPIPFDGQECSDVNQRGLYVHRPHPSLVQPGRTFRFSLMQPGWKPCRQYSYRAIISPAPPSAGGLVPFGQAIKNRQHLDGWTNAIYITDPNIRSSHTGLVKNWHFYAKRTGRIFLQVWTPVSHLVYKLRGQTRIDITRLGSNDVPANSIKILKGDVLGYYFTGRSPIPFDGQECSDVNQRGLYVHRPHPSLVQPGRTFRFSLMQPGWKPCRQYSYRAIISPAPPSAGGLVAFGQAIKSRLHLDGWTNSIYITNPHFRYSASQHGVVKKWQFYAKTQGLIFLQVWKRSHGTVYTLRSQTRINIPRAGFNTVDANSIEIERGDVLGYFFPGRSVIPFDGHECSDVNQRGLYVQRPTHSLVQPGRAFRFSLMQPGWKPCRQYSYRAIISPAPAPCVDSSIEGLRSQPGSTKTTLTIKNLAKSSANVYWITHQGTERLYHGNIAPGRSFTQGTYVGHPWIARAAGDGGRLMHLGTGADSCSFTPSSTQPVVIFIRD